jgi:hypothetical protein
MIKIAFFILDLLLLLSHREGPTNSTNEEYYYGNPKLDKPLALNSGDEIYVFKTSWK